MSKKNKQLRKITKKAVRKAFKQYWRLLFPPNFFTNQQDEAIAEAIRARGEK
jgi:hypothetical protein